ncbi:hypothetical protein NPIL_140581 [Nephila pilipes]|uniref:Uncharacterized protein n=1 Tax=Nephila pilipes TaxID=299642 RepID=A0A8X6MZV8_NEPPI|nr:hypothetical protein NPIL_140581 [Nephila pilipes]
MTPEQSCSKDNITGAPLGVGREGKNHPNLIITRLSVLARRIAASAIYRKRSEDNRVKRERDDGSTDMPEKQRPTAAGSWADFTARWLAMFHSLCPRAAIELETINRETGKGEREKHISGERLFIRLGSGVETPSCIRSKRTKGLHEQLFNSFLNVAPPPCRRSRKSKSQHRQQIANTQWDLEKLQFHYHQLLIECGKCISLRSLLLREGSLRLPPSGTSVRQSGAR